MPEQVFEPISRSVIQRAAARVAGSGSVRESLPGGAVLNIDRLLPFLCVYRRDPTRRDSGTGLFVTAEACYLNAPGAATRRKGMRLLIRELSEAVSSQLGAVLILEVWSGEDRDVPRAVDDLTGEPLLPRPAFRIHTRLPHAPAGTVAQLEFELQRIKVHRQAAEVEVNLRSRNHPPRMLPLISAADAERLNCFVLGLEIRPIYRNPQTGETYQGLLRLLRRGVARALKKAFFTFALDHTNIRPQHFYVLGRKTLPQQVWNVDRQLADVSSQFKFLLLVTPVNAERAWRNFAESQYAREPRFQYRPLAIDPLRLKRKLLGIRTDRIEDPTMAHLLRQTQDELDRQINMLGDVGTPRFLPGSLQVYGGVEPSLLGLACEILEGAPESGEDRGEQSNEETGAVVGAQEFARRAAAEIRHYRRLLKGFVARAVVRDDIYSGLLSTGGNLYIGAETTLASDRVDGLLQHEVGTHLVTYYNGAAQPLRLLRVGLAGYDGLQEGLAVLSEYLVGGLTRGRLRTLAARVIATDRMIRGAPFSESFRLLVEQHRFAPRVAYTIVSRVYRGGGLTKDAVYLRGLVEILNYLGRGGELEPLFIGKLAVDHIPIVRELQFRGVLRPSPLRPRYLDGPQAVERLDRLRQGIGVRDLLER